MKNERSWWNWGSFTPNGDLVGKQQPGPPGACGGNARDHSDHGEQHPEQQPPMRVDRHPVGRPRPGPMGDRPVDGPQPVRENRVRSGDQRHEQPGDEEHRPSRAVGGIEDGRVVDGPVPQVIRPDTSHDGDHDDQAISPPMIGRTSRGQRSRASGGRPAGCLAGPEGRNVTDSPSHCFGWARRQSTPRHGRQAHRRLPVRLTAGHTRACRAVSSRARARSAAGHAVAGLDRPRGR